MKRLAQHLYSWRGPFLWLIAVSLTLITANLAYQLLQTNIANQRIRALNANKPERPTTADHMPAVVLARVNNNLFRDDFDAAQSVVVTAGENLPDRTKAVSYFNIANARIRHAIELIQGGDIDTATAYVNVAKGEYRRALRLAPEMWDAKFNLDVAMRMVRDLPRTEAELEEPPPDAPKQVWTDLPGVPRGLP